MEMNTINKIREASGLSRAEFSRIYGIPLRSLEDWEAGRRKCPDYLVGLLSRVVVEDIHREILGCYDKDVLKELGACYKELLQVMNPVGNNPYPYADIYPTKYFTMLHNQAVRMGIPDTLSRRISLLLDSVDPDDWAKSMDIPVPTEKQQYFMMGMLGYGT